MPAALLSVTGKVASTVPELPSVTVTSPIDSESPAAAVTSTGAVAPLGTTVKPPSAIADASFVYVPGPSRR